MSEEKYLPLLDIHKFSFKSDVVNIALYKIFINIFIVFLCSKEQRKKHENVEEWQRGKLFFSSCFWGYKRCYRGNQKINVAQGIA